MSESNDRQPSSQTLIDMMSTAVLQIDKELIITSVNPAAVALFTQYVEQFKHHWPSFSPENLVGECIDQFHKDPSHQRKLLADPSKMPYSTMIRVDDLTMRLNVNAIHNAEGDHTGSLLEWIDVTESEKQRRHSAKQASMLQNLQMPIMAIDTDLNINFINDTAIKMFREKIALFRTINPSFDPDTLMGTCIDCFHKDPSHQRRLLSDPNNLPYTGTVQIEHVTMQLKVSAQFEDDGTYVGATLEWHDVTEITQKRREIEAKAAEDAENVKKVLHVVEEAGQGNLDVEVPELGDNPIGQIAQGLGGMIAHLKQTLETIEAKTVEDQRRVDDLLEMVNATAQGDFTVKTNVHGQDPIGQLAAGLGSMIDDLRVLISKVSGSSIMLGEIAETISGSSRTVAESAVEQGLAIEEMNGSVEEMSASIDMIANNAKRSKEIADQTQREAEVGSDALKQTMVSMEEISKSSEDIGEIIEVIKGIADQTNLLAFNAAIEAARAGDHGLGFSVVADEVRKLAEKSSAAAKEISSLINTSIKKIQAGDSISRDASTAFTKILHGVKDTSKSISQISHATEEQSIAMKEVARTVEKIAEKADQSSKTAGQIATSGKELSGSTTDLLGKVKDLKV